MKLLLATILLFICSVCYGITIKATGIARAVIVNSASIEIDNQPITIVYTAAGPTAQVVF